MSITLEALKPILSGLSGVRQNPAYHGEGDALTHTMLVMDELRGLPGFAAMSEPDQETMLLSAALHDIGKKVCTKLENGQWTSPHHSGTGASIARELLMSRFDLGGTPEAMARREAVCALIRWHMRPVYALSSPNPGRMARQMAAMGELAPFFTLERLAMLAEADNRGRVCDDLRARLEDIALFVQLADEERCLSGPFAYPDAASRYADLSGRNVLPGQPVYDDTWGSVTMMSGLPGTGKDTYISQHFPDLPMLSLDNLRRELRVSPAGQQGAVIQLAKERARQHLRRRQPFVLNATSLSPMIRRQWIELFHQYGASVRIIYLETGWAERERRNAARQDRVPDAAMENMLRSLTPPTLAEAEEVRWVCV